VRTWSSVVVVVLALGCARPTTVPSDPPGNPPEKRPGGGGIKLDADLAVGVYDLVNRERKNRGLFPLDRNPDLEREAANYAYRMATSRTLSHDLGGSFQQRTEAWQVGLFGSAAENIAAGQRTAEEAVSAWMNSPPHRQNLLGDFRKTGVGVAVDGSGKVWWCQDFVGVRRGQMVAPGGVEQLPSR
jgi:uncharacterized protein YkwD